MKMREERWMGTGPGGMMVEARCVVKSSLTKLVDYIRVSLNSPRPYFRPSGAMQSFGGCLKLECISHLERFFEKIRKNRQISALKPLPISHRSTYTPIIPAMATTYQDAIFSSAIISCQTQSPLSISYSHYPLVLQTYSHAHIKHHFRLQPLQILSK